MSKYEQGVLIGIALLAIWNLILHCKLVFLRTDFTHAEKSFNFRLKVKENLHRNALAEATMVDVEGSFKRWPIKTILMALLKKLNVEAKYVSIPPSEPQIVNCKPTKRPRRGHLNV